MRSKWMFVESTIGRHKSTLTRKDLSTPGDLRWLISGIRCIGMLMEDQPLCVGQVNDRH